MHIDAGVVVREARGFGFTVVTVDRMVKTLAHVIGERERAIAADAFGKEFGERRHAPWAPALSEASSARICFHARRNISSAASRSMISAQSLSGKPAMPVPTAGNAMDLRPRSWAIRKE